ncbi:MAG: efflux RND transporter permease subunit [Gemmatimonadaceae bacterium]|nr:efflux RND transporter permease subunit [Gemmatimonadaceae bacterium]
MISAAVSRPAVVWAAAVTLLLAGLVSFTRLPLATRTSIELPRLSITSSWTGASAELLEMYVSSPIESAIQSVRGVRRTRSESSENGSRITVELEADADVQIARLSILERMELLRPEFPPGVTQPRVSNYVPEELSEEDLLTLTISGPYTAGTLQKIADEQVEPRLSAVPGVGNISVQGGTEPGVSITYDPALLRQLGISPQLLGDALDGARVVQSLGTDQRGGTERPVVMRDQPAAVEELANLPIIGRGGQPFALGSLATVRPEEDTRGLFFRINGQPAIAIGISRLAGADAIKTAAAVRQALREIEGRLPPAVRLNVVYDDSVELARQLRDLLIRGAIAFGLVLVVLLVLLRDWRGTGLVMLSASVSVAGTALLLFLFDIPANLLTLAGLAMGVGILVQDGLIVMDRLGTVPDTPADRARVARAIAPAVIGATLTTAVVLFPFLYLQGNARTAFVPFASAFTIALGWSLIASVVMVPALARGHRVHETSFPRARRFYARLVIGVMRWRWATLTATVATLGVLTWAFIVKVPRVSFGGFGEQRTTLSAFINFPRGSDPASLDAAMREMEAQVVGRPGVEQVTAQSYGGFGAGMRVLFRREAEYSAIPQELEEALTQRAVYIGGASVSVRGNGPGFSSGMGSVSSATFRIKVLGYSFGGVERLAMDLKERLERIPRVRDVDINASSFFSTGKAYAVTILPDRSALERYGVTAAAFSAAVAREVRGPVGRQLLEIGGEEIPVTVKAAGARERSLDELRQSIVPSPNGAPVTIAALASVDEREALSAISREDQQYVRIVAYEFRGPNKLAQRTHDAFMQSITLPPGYSAADAGFGFFEPDDSEQGLWLVFAIGVTLVLLTVAIVFDSVWAAGMVFCSLPVALGGVVAAFWVSGASFTREAAVGVILVVGLAVHQAILLIDAALERRRRGTVRRQLHRLTPLRTLRASVDRAGMIVLVTLASLASLLPLAIGEKSDTLFGAIALATAGGTLAGTLAAMVVLPALVVRGARRVRRTAKAP